MGKLQEVDSYEESLKAIKKEIQEANGTYKVETIDHISNTIERAEIFLNASIDTLNLAGVLDDDFEVNYDKSLTKEMNDTKISTKMVHDEEASNVLNSEFDEAS